MTASRASAGVTVIIVPARESLVLEAAELKAVHPLSYADAFTARQAALPILTGDPEILGLPRSVVRAVERRR